MCFIHDGLQVLLGFLQVGQLALQVDVLGGDILTGAVFTLHIHHSRFDLAKSIIQFIRRNTDRDGSLWNSSTAGGGDLGHILGNKVAAQVFRQLIDGITLFLWIGDNNTQVYVCGNQTGLGCCSAVRGFG